MSVAGSSKSRISKAGTGSARGTRKNYDGVQAVVDTGNSLTREQMRRQRIGEDVKIAPNELFKRMKVTTFAQLVIQVAAYGDAPQNDELHSEYHQNGDAESRAAVSKAMSTARPDTARTDTDMEISAIMNGGSKTNGHVNKAATNGSNSNGGTSVVRKRSLIDGGVGEMDSDDGSQEKSTWNWRFESSAPYLLLDCRPPLEYGKNHIISALNYPSAMLARSVNYETKELLSFKNKPGKLIVLYDDEEHITPMVARTLIDRGYENIFVLTGGLKLVHRLFPTSLITGTFPYPNDAAAPMADPSILGFTNSSVAALEDELGELFFDRSVGARLSRATTVASRNSTGNPPSTRFTSSAKAMAGRPPFRPV